jgi:DNA-directed RNA polymerase subunit RPC12/RpoP
MTACERCGDRVEHGGGERFQIRGYDYSESSAATFQGQLCLRCWNRFTEFMLGRPVFEHPDRRREVDA